MAERQQPKYFLVGPAFPCTSIQHNPSSDSLNSGIHDKGLLFTQRLSIHQRARTWAARNCSFANGSNAQLTGTTELPDGNFQTSYSSSVTLPTETVCKDRCHLHRTVNQFSRSRSYTDNASDNGATCRADANSWLAGAWHAMRSTLASATMTSASRQYAHQHSVCDDRFPNPTANQGAGGNEIVTASGVTRDRVAGIPCNAASVSTGTSDHKSDRVGSFNGGQGCGHGGADGGSGSDSGGAGWASGLHSRGAPQALFSLARADDADQRRLRNHRGWGEDAAYGAGGRGGGFRSAGVGAGTGDDLDLAKAEAVLADLMRDGGGGGGGGGDEAALDGASGDAADAGGAAATEAALSRLECGFCHRRLSSRRRPRRASTAALLCDGCHRGFHADCCRYRGLDTRPRRRRQVTEGSGEGTVGAGRGGDDAAGSGGEVWYHSKDCSECAAQWQRRAAAGPSPAAGGRTWLLAAPELYGMQGAARQEVLDALQQASAVLSAEYGPRVVDAVLDSDYAVVLRDARGAAVSAATVDVYGREVVVMDLAATSDEARGRGHFRALVTSLESWLDEAKTQHWVVALAPGKEGKAAQRMWRDHGFRPLPPRQARAWARQLPGFPEVSGGGAGKTVLLERHMAAGAGRRGGGCQGGGVRGALQRVVGAAAMRVGGAVKGILGYVVLWDR